ncbi:MAG: type II secretion system GspH family protein [Oscillospiraceae bacterium]|nr:type II secretion system GspH family protein [Oscillospiraceae bacterium]
MKNKLKGFTLVELVVVMALMSILMLAIMNMFKPIRETYVDTTQYEAQRTAQNGVIKYITESVRFSTDMGIYNNVSSASDAVEAFATAYCTANSIDSSKETAVKEAINKNAEVIIIDNTTSHYSKNFTGRLIRRKVDGTDNNVGTPTFIGTNNLVDTTNSKWRTALGEAYYGENTYYITLDVSDSANGMLNINAVSTRNGKRDISNINVTNTSVTDNVTRGGVFCRNLVTTVASNPKAKGVVNSGMYDVDYSADNSKNAYIVFLNLGEEDRTVTPHTFTGKKAVEEAAK